MTSGNTATQSTAGGFVPEVAGNGETFWPKGIAAGVAVWLASNEYAIVGGEVYRRHNGAWGTYTGAWKTEPGLGQGEDWHEYVKRGLAQALWAVRQEPTAWAEFPDVPSNVLFFFGYMAQSEYTSPALTPSELWGNERPTTIAAA